jgi:predicted nucleic acid-binding protein
MRLSLSAFVTYDKKLARAAQQAGLTVLSPG